MLDVEARRLLCVGRSSLAGCKPDAGQRVEVSSSNWNPCNERRRRDANQPEQAPLSALGRSASVWSRMFSRPRAPLAHALSEAGTTTPWLWFVTAIEGRGALEYGREGRGGGRVQVDIDGID